MIKCVGLSILIVGRFKARVCVLSVCYYSVLPAVRRMLMKKAVVSRGAVHTVHPLSLFKYWTGAPLHSRSIRHVWWRFRVPPHMHTGSGGGAVTVTVHCLSSSPGFSGWKAFETDKRRPGVNELGTSYGNMSGPKGWLSDINSITPATRQTI